MADSSDIDNALVAKLAGDSALTALCPDGVWVDEAPQNKTRFVIVSLVDEEDDATFDKGRAIEDGLYLVEARLLSKTTAANVNTKAAAARIDALLEDQTLTVAGFTCMAMHRERRIRLTEVDELDLSIRWFRRGGHYRVQMSID